MRRKRAGARAGAVAVVMAAAAAACGAVLAFPGADGFGAGATGGRGGEVYHVRNLDDAGPGSFRDAVSQPGRTVVFDVGGVIRLKSPVVLSSNLTVAGQTSPGEGITVFGHGVSLSHRENVIVRYMRFRGSHEMSRGSKSLNVADGHGMIFDHCSISWGRWDDLGFTEGSHDITLQDCIVGEAIDPQRFGALIDGANNITVARNLWIDNTNRNPKGKANLQYINNVVYNWGTGGYAGGHSGAEWKQDLVGNYFIKGPSSSDGFLGMFARTDLVYQAGNKADLDRDGKLNGRDVTDADFRPAGTDSGTLTFVPAAQNHPAVEVPVLSAEEAYARVVAGAGASLHRDEVDRRLIEQVKSLGRSGAIIKDEAEAGGIGEAGSVAGIRAPVDSDGDGIPDDWERAHGSDPASAADGRAVAGTSQYTNLEIYLSSLVPAEPAAPAASRSSK